MKQKGKTIKINKLILLYVISIIFMFTILYYVYENHKKMIISMQQEQLIISADVASMYLEDFFDENLKLADAYFDFRGYTDDSCDMVMEKIKKYGESKKEYVDSISFVEKRDITNENLEKIFGVKGEEILKYREEIGRDGSAVLGPLAADEGGGFDLLILKEAQYNGEDLGLIVLKIDLKSVYAATIGNIQLGNYGYFTIKDQRGTILMHSDTSQIGVNSFQERMEKYPHISKEEITSLINSQLRGERGSSIIESYWWGTDEENKTKKIISFVPSHIGGRLWIVNAVMSYDEIAKPIRNTGYVLFILGAVILFVSCTFIFKFTKISEAGKHYKMKAEYENRLNEALKKLIKHEENLNRLNRIETLGMFSGAMAHDIRNYLVPIKIYCDILMGRHQGDSGTMECLKDMEKAVDNCTMLTKNVLKYCGGDSRDENITLFDSTDAVGECLSLAKTMLPDNISLQCDIQEEKIVLLGNQLEFKQILLNLMTNSYQAMEGDGGTLSVRFFMENNEAVLNITDTGCGMTEEQKKDIFIPFYTFKDEKKGTGLGLPIVKRLVEEFNGTIEFSSSPGRGTSFILRFPVKL